jgi:hypothetical protein
MPPNRYDQACRYAAKKLDVPGFLAWLLREPAAAVRFLQWLDTRTLPFPGEPDRTCDTVARLADDDPAMHWAVVLEFCIKPVPDFFGRVLAYLGQLWLEVRPNETRGERFQVGAVVVNLTGHGRTGRDMRLRQTGIRTCVEPLERNLSEEDAAATLDGIAAGRISRALLPWIPLMTGGGEAGIIQKRVELAKAEQNERVRADYGGLVVVFAEAAGREAVWREAMKEWNMVESPFIKEFEMAAEKKGAVQNQKDNLLWLLERRFPTALPAELVAAITTTSNLDQLKKWTTAAYDAPTLDAFRQAMKS